MEKAVITGGAGFAGSHLAEALLKQGFAVTIIDDLSTGKLENIKPFAKDVIFIKDTIGNLPDLKKNLKNADYIFHFAAMASVPGSIADPALSHEVNNTGTLNVLMAAARNNVKKLVFMSSASVYGDAPDLPVTEDTVPRPKSPYAVDKLAAEYYCQVFRNIYNLPTVCLRCFNIYGPRQDPASEYAAAIPVFINLALKGRPLTIYGDGKQTRDYIYVKDVAEANLLAAKSDAEGIYNISSGKSISIDELAGLIIRLTGNKSKIIYDKARPGDIIHSLADISKAGKIGFKPRYTVEEGLAETIAYYRGC